MDKHEYDKLVDAVKDTGPIEFCTKYSVCFKSDLYARAFWFVHKGQSASYVNNYINGKVYCFAETKDGSFAVASREWDSTKDKYHYVFFIDGAEEWLSGDKTFFQYCLPRHLKSNYNSAIFSDSTTKGR